LDGKAFAEVEISMRFLCLDGKAFTEVEIEGRRKSVSRAIK
jgi:hypothetical protein